MRFSSLLKYPNPVYRYSSPPSPQTSLWIPQRSFRCWF